MSIDDVIVCRVELQCVSMQRWRGSGYFPWLQFGQTANSATTATSGHLVIGCCTFILRAAGQLKNFYSSFVVLMYCFFFQSVGLEREVHVIAIKPLAGEEKKRKES